MTNEKRSLYEVLGLTPDATAPQIKKAFRKLAMKHHPDRNAGDAEAEAKYKEITHAYEVLIDAERRQLYDETGDSSDGIRQGQILSVLMPVVLECIQEAYGSRNGLESSDLVKLIRNKLEVQIRELEELIPKLRDNNRKAIVIALERLKLKTNGTNIIGEALQSQLRNIDEHLENVSRKVLLMKKAHDFMKAYEYDWTKQLPDKANPFGYSGPITFEGWLEEFGVGRPPKTKGKQQP